MKDLRFPFVASPTDILLLAVSFFIGWRADARPQDLGMLLYANAAAIFADGLSYDNLISLTLGGGVPAVERSAISSHWMLNRLSCFEGGVTKISPDIGGRLSVLESCRSGRQNAPDSAFSNIS